MLNSSRDYTVLVCEATGQAEGQTVCSNAVGRDEFGRGVSGCEAVLRYPQLRLKSLQQALKEADSLL